MWWIEFSAKRTFQPKTLTKNNTNRDSNPGSPMKYWRKLNKGINYLKYIRLKNHIRRNDLHTQYKQLRNKVLEMIRINKKEFYKNYFENNNKNLRKVWQGIREIINVKSKHSDLPTCISTDEKKEN